MWKVPGVLNKPSLWDEATVLDFKFSRTDGGIWLCSEK